MSKMKDHFITMARAQASFVRAMVEAGEEARANAPHCQQCGDIMATSNQKYCDTGCSYEHELEVQEAMVTLN